MGIRGRKSAASLAVIGPGGVQTIRRPDPPAELTGEQADEWTAIVNSMSADWFPRATWPVLAQLCRHIIRARRLAQLLDATEKSDGFDVKEYRDLLRSEEEQSRAIASLETKLRITQQATVDKRTNKRGASVKRPWETDEG